MNNYFLLGKGVILSYEVKIENLKLVECETFTNWLRHWLWRLLAKRREK